MKKIESMVPEKPVPINRKTVRFKSKKISKDQEISAVPEGYFIYYTYPWDGESGHITSDKRFPEMDGIMITNYDILEDVEADGEGVRTIEDDCIEDNYDWEFDPYLDFEISSISLSLPEILTKILKNNLITHNGEVVGVERDNYYHFVEFLRNQRYWGNSTIPTGEEPELPHCREQFALLIEEMENAIPEISNKSEKYALQDSIKWSKLNLKAMVEEPWDVQYINLYNIILKNWTYIKKLPCTYLFLIDLVGLEEKWRDNAEERAEIFQLLRDMNYEWEYFRG